LSVQALFAKRRPGALNYGRRLSCLAITVAWDDGAIAEGRPASSMARRMLRPSKKAASSSPSATAKIGQERQEHMTSRQEPMASAARPLDGTVKGGPARGGLKPCQSQWMVAVDDTGWSNECDDMSRQQVTLPKPTQSEAAQQRICVRWIRRLCSHRSVTGKDKERGIVMLPHRLTVWSDVHVNYVQVLKSDSSPGRGDPMESEG
jgi:hypothetical protein